MSLGGGARRTAAAVAGAVGAVVAATAAISGAVVGELPGLVVPSAKLVRRIAGSQNEDSARLRAQIACAPIPTPAKRTGEMLLTFYSRENKDAHPSVRTLAEEVGCTDRTIRRHKVILQSGGLIAQFQRWRLTDRTKDRPRDRTNVIWFPIAVLPAAAAPPEDFFQAVDRSQDDATWAEADAARRRELELERGEMHAAAVAEALTRAAASSARDRESPAAGLEPDLVAHWLAFDRGFRKAYRQSYAAGDAGSVGLEGQERAAVFLRELTGEAAAWATTRGLELDRERIESDLAERLALAYLAMAGTHDFLRAHRHQLGFLTGGKRSTGDLAKVRADALAAWKTIARGYKRKAAPTPATSTTRQLEIAGVAAEAPAPPPVDARAFAAALREATEGQPGKPRAFIPRAVDLAPSSKETTPSVSSSSVLPVVTSKLGRPPPILDAPDVPPGRPKPS